LSISPMDAGAAPGVAHFVGTLSANSTLYSEEFAAVPINGRSGSGASIAAAWRPAVHSIEATRMEERA
jgi:hypothetical protein